MRRGLSAGVFVKGGGEIKNINNFLVDCLYLIMFLFGTLRPLADCCTFRQGRVRNYLDSRRYSEKRAGFLGT